MSMPLRSRVRGSFKASLMGELQQVRSFGEKFCGLAPTNGGTDG